VLAIDRFLTQPVDAGSYQAPAIVNGDCTLLLDLRNWEQKFAFYYGCMEPDLVAAVKSSFDGGVFYDIGASIGLYTATFGRICRERGGYVRAIEPVPANLARLQSQLALNRLDGSLVQIDGVALGDSCGAVQMTLTDGNKPGNAKITTDGNLTVRMVTLDELWRGHGCESIGFIKLDTEGWDAKVILGGREAIRACRPNLLVEFNRERMRNQHIPLEPCWNFLVEELGYRPHCVKSRGRAVPVESAGNLENLLFLRDSSTAKRSAVTSLAGPPQPLER
jgi:FkbM family methyltransferase